MRDRVPHTTIVDLLALTLGDERARLAWGEALRGVGASEGVDYDAQQTTALLTALGLAQGSLGLAARVARIRLDPYGASSSIPTEKGPAPDSPRSSGPSVAAPHKAEPRIEPSPQHSIPAGESARIAIDVLSFLSPSLGDEKARDALGHHAKTLGISLSTLTRAEALTLLEAMSQASGLLGVVARFAKVRFEGKYPGA